MNAKGADDEDPKPWTVLDSRYVYQSPWLNARQDHVRLGNGREIPDMYVLEYPDWVNAVLLTPARKVVLIRIYRHGLGQVHFEVPGGCVDEGESPLAAASREALEETGFGSEHWSSLGFCCANPATHNNRTHLFLAMNASLKAEPEREPTEELRVVLVDLEEIPGLIGRMEVVQASHALALTRLCQVMKLKVSWPFPA